MEKSAAYGRFECVLFRRSNYAVVESKNLSTLQILKFKFWLPVSSLWDSGTPAIIFSIFLYLQLCIERVFVRSIIIIR